MKSEIKKVLFYTDIPRTFRTSQIYHLYEISQTYPVILLSEELDPATESILNNKKIFPKLEKIIPAYQFTGQKANFLVKNRRLYKLAKDVVEKYRPDVFVGGDMWLLQLYISRLARRIKSSFIHIAFQGGFSMGMREARLFSNLMNIYLRTPSFLPLPLRSFLVKGKKCLGHYFYYWILPLIVGQLPFRGKSSFIRFQGGCGLRACDYYVIYSKRDYDICIKDGIPVRKLYILQHPLKRPATKNFLETNLFSSALDNSRADKKILTIMLPNELISIKKSDRSLISKDELKKNRLEIINLIVKNLKRWEIIIKPHPLMMLIPGLFQKTIQDFQVFSKQIQVVNPMDSADKYIRMSTVIVGFPPASTTLLTASLQCPEKIILSIDLQHEFFGDCYKNFHGIEYIDNKEELTKTLTLIRDNNYCKHRGNEQESSDFESAAEVLKYVLQKNHNYYK